MQYTITTTTSFSAAHRLRGYDGDCSELHGHNWKVEVSIKSSKLDENGFVIDFLVLDEILKEVIHPFDHCELNTIPPFTKLNPTAENLASHFFHEINTRMNEGYPDTSVSEVVVWEMDGYKASVTS